MSHSLRKPVNERFLNSYEAQSLTTFAPRMGDEAFMYHPREEGVEPLGPLRPLVDFTNQLPENDAQDSVLLCDPGTDDMLAGFLALDRSSKLKLRMIIPSFGNVGGDQTLKNTLTLVSLTKAFKVEVAKGSQTPLADANLEDASEEHGADGLNGATPINSDEVEAGAKSIKVLNNGVDVLTNEILRRHENDEPPLTILNTGTMTDLALVLQKLDSETPDAIRKIKGISMMGCGIDRGLKKADGTFEKWHTNITPHSEFNINKDPHAAALAFELIQAHRIKTIVFPLDLTHQTGVRQNYEGAWLKEQAHANGNPVSDFAAQLFHAGNFDIDRSQNIYGFSKEDTTRFMHDPNVVTGLDRPEYYHGFPASIEIITEGEEAGRSIITSNPNGTIFVAVEANAPEVIRNWQQTLANFSLDPELDI